MAPSINFTGFINDGYTRQAFVAKVDGIFDELKITYRPCTTEERAAHGDDIANQPLASANKRASALLAKHIKSWSIHGVKADAAVMLKLNLNLFNRLYQIVLGNDVGDKEPVIDPSDKSDEGSGTNLADLTPAVAVEGTNAGN